MGLLVRRDLAGISGHRRIGEVDAASAGRLSARSGTGKEAFRQAGPAGRIDVELRFEIFEVEREIQDIAVRHALRGDGTGLVGEDEPAGCCRSGGEATEHVAPVGPASLPRLEGLNNLLIVCHRILLETRSC